MKQDIVKPLSGMLGSQPKKVSNAAMALQRGSQLPCCGMVTLMRCGHKGSATHQVFAVSAAALVTVNFSWYSVRRRRSAKLQTVVSRHTLQCQAVSSDQELFSKQHLEELRRIWQTDIRPSFAPEIDADPYLSPPDVDKLLMCFLRAEDGDVGSAAVRLRETAEFRRDYRCVDFYRPGMARQLFMHASNPGASIYFGDIGLRDRSGEPVLIGRTSLMTDAQAPGRKPADDRIPATHLRGGIFVIERIVHEADQAISYIVDVGPYPKEDMAKHSNQRFWDADGVVDCSAALKQGQEPATFVGPHLKDHIGMKDGLPVLKEAIRMVTRYYPERLGRIYFYRPGFIFRTIFAIFSLWVKPKTREKFVLVNEGEEHKHFLAPSGLHTCDPDQVPPEFGGTGPSLDGDRFLRRAMDRYDAMAGAPEAELVMS
eukprot:TRINITY_DN32471_c0_g1_i1.p1 TRINITY_DN32471_c0_g1~~TRINITY_DN32471_c0_g1_i1.p1  ORF type:complete len:427 (-),score=76.11 TRINITY_DN32471_c0_g1_i1:422-1702(-)